MSIQSKDFHVCQKRRDSTANHNFFQDAKTWFLISKCMFNGHRTIEHEENVVRIVNLFRWKRIRKWFKFCYSKITSFFSKAIACWLLAKIASLCSKYMPPAKIITLHLDFHTLTVKHLPRYGWINFGSGKMLWSRQFYQLNASTTGYPVAIMVSCLQKINKWCSFSVFRFSVTVGTVFNPHVLDSWTMS